jgi:hypothetical protein
MNNQLAEFEVSDKASFVQFLTMLHEDFIHNPENWENRNLGDFLEAMSRYVDDMQGYYNNTNQSIDTTQPSWKVFADVLKGATLYE